MKKGLKLLLSLTVILTLATSLIACNSKSSSKTTGEDAKVTVRLNEVTRSVFYGPMYVAISQGFFDKEGITIDLATGQGADKVMQAVLSNNADIGFCGPEQVIYINNQGREDYPVVFAGLTQKDGSFLVGRNKETKFDWNTLRGKEVIGGRPGGVPAMALEYAMKNNNINPKTDVNMVTNIDFAATSGAFKGGTGDYVALFEPTASMLEKEGSGCILASVGENSGVIPYTCFFSTKSYLDNNKETIEKFTRAIYKGQQWYFSHTPEEIADSIIQFFPGTDRDIIIRVINNYNKIDALAHDPSIKEENLDRLIDIIQEYDKSLIPSKPDFNKIVDNSFAEKATK
ncbi:ABC transporter substrate-binding protein [Clostridium botulinum]|uniref:ABC transporter substrate-binding protein n=2 Tax=Clostridium botulinum TaxID=1491 RepID=UPI0007747A3C|nr:ABC transporter substrate-binding protein [Clostridium botulinum]MBN1068569.1 ABC transporter substrate-binding protein [Clostridium botulinum]NFL86275.1 ABC transporter substrate-binding protein [Clostridium botulinum]NFO21101.1 ABC transporter substrate-binding protein [Clostridium botulinum]